MPTESSDVYQENTNMPTKSSDVYQEIQDILASYFCGIPMSCLSWLEMRYEQKFKRSLDYNSLGVENIEGLLFKMHNKHMVLLSEEPESKETYVMCARLVEIRQKVYLKRNVQELLNKHGGEIPLSSFEGKYKDKFKVKLNYHDYGLTSFYHLCEVLNLVVEEANSPGEKVIKAGKIYNLRKRKK
ncbi:endonuclease [Tanacetum coccineum]